MVGIFTRLREALMIEQLNLNGLPNQSAMKKRFLQISRRTRNCGHSWCVFVMRLRGELVMLAWLPAHCY
jgi:hypothetical protein